MHTGSIPDIRGIELMRPKSASASVPRDGDPTYRQDIASFQEISLRPGEETQQT